VLPRRRPERNFSEERCTGRLLRAYGCPYKGSHEGKPLPHFLNPLLTLANSEKSVKKSKPVREWTAQETEEQCEAKECEPREDCHENKIRGGHWARSAFEERSQFEA